MSHDRSSERDQQDRTSSREPAGRRAQRIKERQREETEKVKSRFEPILTTVSVIEKIELSRYRRVVSAVREVTEFLVAGGAG